MLKKKTEDSLFTPHLKEFFGIPPSAEFFTKNSVRSLTKADLFAFHLIYQLTIKTLI